MARVLKYIKLNFSTPAFLGHEKYEKGVNSLKLKRQSRCFILILVSLIFFVCSVGIALADGPYRVLILPFKIHSEKDLSFLNDGILEMLSSRLSEKEGVTIIRQKEIMPFLQGKSIPDEDAAIALGARLQADYVLTGSLTVFGESVGMDGRFISVRQKAPTVTFHESGKSRGQVIDYTARFAEEIRAKGFPQTAVSRQTPQPQQEATPEPVPPATPAAPVKAADTKRPAIATDVQVPETPQSLVAKAPEKSAPQTERDGGTSWKSRRFNTKIRGISIGDVDGNGSNDVVFAGSNDIHVYRHVSDRLVKLAEIKGKSYAEILGVDAADINQNGKAEIFVTSLEKKKHLNSYVLEWNGSGLTRIADRQNWYYRVLNVPGSGSHLMGQKRGLVGESSSYDVEKKSELFLPGIYELKWSGGQYESAGRQIFPEWVNVFGFAYGDILNNGQESVLAFREDGQICVTARNGYAIWQSSETYGGSLTYVEFPMEGGGRNMDHFYIPQRLRVADLDKDGKNEMILVKNMGFTRQILSRFRDFSSGQIECLAWDDEGLKRKWETDEVSGYISDYVIGDLNNDGQDELVYAVIEKAESLLKKKRSRIMAWHMNAAR